LTRLAAVIREIRVFAHPPLQAHPNIVRLLGSVWEDEDGAQMSPVSILEYADQGSLLDLLEFEVMLIMLYKCREHICLDISNDLDALHQCKVIWGDCKPGNIPIFSNSLGLVIAAVMLNGSHFDDLIEKNQEDQPEDEMKVHVQQAKIVGILPALFEDTAKKALRPNLDGLHSPLASELDLEAMGWLLGL
jgi:serine/threonine protein kinase